MLIGCKVARDTQQNCNRYYVWELFEISFKGVPYHWEAKEPRPALASAGFRFCFLKDD